MKNSLPIILILTLVLLLATTAAFAAPSDQSEVRAAVQHIFNQLKSGEYEALYDALPASARTRISRERLVQGLQRSQNAFQLQRIEIGTVSLSGNLAVVDTTMFAHIAKPFDGDGKLVVIIPGFMGNDFYLMPMLNWLRRIGYTPVRAIEPMSAVAGR